MDQSAISISTPLFSKTSSSSSYTTLFYFKHISSHSKLLSNKLSKISWNLFFYNKLSYKKYEECFERFSVGRNKGSSPSRNIFSNIRGISLQRTGADSSRQGLVLTSKSQGEKDLSMRKSNPKSSKPLTFLALSSLKQVALTTISAIDFILATKSCTLYFSSGKLISRYRWNSVQETLFPFSYLEQVSFLDCIASFVR